MENKLFVFLKANLDNIIFLVVIFVILFFWFSKKLQQKVIFLNYSGQTVKTIDISVVDQNVKFSRIPVGTKRSKRIKVKQDASFSLKIELKDGTIIEKEKIGYITNGDNSDNFFTLDSNYEISFTQTLKDCRSAYQ